MDILRGILLYLKRDKLKWRGMSDEDETYAESFDQL